MASLNYYGFSCFHAFAQTVRFAQNISQACLLGELSPLPPPLPDETPYLSFRISSENEPPVLHRTWAWPPGAAVLADVLDSRVGKE